MPDNPTADLTLGHVIRLARRDLDKLGTKVRFAERALAAAALEKTRLEHFLERCEVFKNASDVPEQKIEEIDDGQG